MRLINGAAAHDTEDATWEIVGTPGGSLIGRVTSAEGDELTLDPAFVYMVQVQRGPQGVQVGREVIPVEFWVSSPPMRVRWTVRRRVIDFDEADRKEIAKLIEQARETVKQVRAARSGLVTANVLPGPGARS